MSIKDICTGRVLAIVSVRRDVEDPVDDEKSRLVALPAGRI